jgi:Fe-S-cluster containining protein
MTSNTKSLTVLSEWHSNIDAKVKPLEELHKNRLECRGGCSQCCVDELSVFEVEADRIRAICQDVLAQEPHPKGACAFLNAEGMCRIYAYRPYVCRTQGLPLRWLEESENEVLEYRDICELNDKEPPIEELEPDQFWTLGESEGELAQMQFEAHGGEMTRVVLRELFLSSNVPVDDA